MISAVGFFPGVPETLGESLGRRFAVEPLLQLAPRAVMTNVKI